MKRSRVCIAGLVFLPALSAFGQGMIGFSASSGGTRDGGFQGNATFRLPVFQPPVLTNAPYSGEEVSESSQTLADGTHITRPMMGPQQKTWRDSQGRVRTERSMFGGTNLKDVPVIAQINDPVAGYAYILDNVNHVAHRIKLSPLPQRPAAMVRQANTEAIAAAGGRAMTGVIGAPGAVGGGGGGATLLQMQQAALQGGPGAVGGVGGGGGSAGGGGGANRPNTMERPQMSTEDLGTQLIDGVQVYGTRRTTVIPAGGREGNDRPMTTTSESWYSKDLRLTVLSTNFNPASGTSTNKIANLSTSEPDPALFMVPTDYTIVDETESFTITWGEKK